MKCGVVMLERVLRTVPALKGDVPSKGPVDHVRVLAFLPRSLWGRRTGVRGWQQYIV
jgi:hypothetical protein